jgi:DNA (cytosine-5)-methyltransferase 1
MKYIDLFSGIGSFHYSFRKVGWDCVLASDICGPACDTYKTNYSVTPVGDIVDIDETKVPAMDIVCAGFPCQPFSQAGKRLGFQDATRGTMFWQVMKFVRHHKPSILILENVRGLLNHENGDTLKTIIGEIEDEGYKVSYKLLKCSDYGIPQMRYRLFIVGSTIYDPCELLNFDRFHKTVTLSEFFGRSFERDTAYTIRCGGRRSGLGNKHNWDTYMVDGSEYNLTIEDALRLQGFPSDFRLSGSTAQQWKLLGNTIPTIFTEMLCQNIKRVVDKN